MHLFSAIAPQQPTNPMTRVMAPAIITNDAAVRKLWLGKTTEKESLFACIHIPTANTPHPNTLYKSTPKSSIILIILNIQFNWMLIHWYKLNFPWTFLKMFEILITACRRRLINLFWHFQVIFPTWISTFLRGKIKSKDVSMQRLHIGYSYPNYNVEY